jgi:thiamine biosynthesis lipoprotein
MKPPSRSASPEPGATATLRRARPLLGTLVEIQASGLAVAQLERAVENAFAAIERVQRAMSFHDADSDLSRINRHAARRAVRVEPSTWTVLRHTVTLARASDGAFDPTIAPVLQAWGLLPGKLPCRGRGSAADDWRAIRLLPGNRVRLLAPVTLDLGGIAKGYAVDRAVAALRCSGVPQGLVNAGGDLRVFGPSPAPVHVRHPTEPGRFFSLGELHDGALATSALTWTRALVDPKSRTACGQGVSITVLARTAWLADALTKIVAVTPDPTTAEPLLARHRARAVVLDTQGRAVWLNASVPLPDVA